MIFQASGEAYLKGNTIMHEVRPWTVLQPHCPKPTTLHKDNEKAAVRMTTKDYWSSNSSAIAISEQLSFYFSAMHARM